MMLSDITGLLRENGFKVTPQRLAVYEYLSKTKEHPNAEALFNQLQPQYPTMSLATVYKTIEILSQLGLVKILNTGEDSFRYDADISDHAHVKCKHCNKVEDVPDLLFSDMVNFAEQKTGYEVDSKQIYFYGKCPSCQKTTVN